MVFDEHEDQEEEIGIQVSVNYELGNFGRTKTESEEEAVSPTAARKGGVGAGSYRYRECLKNHTVSIGGQAVDGYGEFIAAGDKGTLHALKCVACNCHRNFHCKEADGEGFIFLHHHHHHHPHPITTNTNNSPLTTGRHCRLVISK